MAIKQVAGTDSLAISFGDYVTLPLRRNGIVSFHELKVDRSGDKELILRMPFDSSAIVVNDKFYSMYEVELTGNRAGHRTFDARWSRAPAPNPYEDYEFTFVVRGEKVVCHGRARTEQRAMWFAVEEYRKTRGFAESQQLVLMKAFSSKATGYNYAVRKL